MKTLILINILVFALYNIFTVSRYGFLPSISDSYYLIRDDKSKFVGEYLFTLFIWFIALSVIIIGSTSLMFFAGAFLAFVGASQAFKDDNLTRKVHVVGAIGGIGIGLISMWIDFKTSIPLIIVLSFILLSNLFNLKNKTYWIEVVAFIVVLFTFYFVK